MIGVGLVIFTVIAGFMWTKLPYKFAKVVVAVVSFSTAIAQITSSNAKSVSEMNQQFVFAIDLIMFLFCLLIYGIDWAIRDKKTMGG